MYAKKYETGGEILVAVCDKELIGKVLREGERVLDLKKHSAFYVGELASERKVAEMLKPATSINLVGKRACAVAFKLKFAKEGDAMTVEGVPHLQIYKIEI